MRQLSGFYHPMDFKIENVPVIVYASRGTDANDAHLAYGRTKAHIRRHITKLHVRHAYLRIGTYQIVFLWSLRGQKMSGIWIFDEKVKEEYESGGALIYAHIFRELTPCGQDQGLASSMTMPVLGAEAALRQDIVDLERFVHSPDIYPAIPGLPLTPKYDTM